MFDNQDTDQRDKPLLLDVSSSHTNSSLTFTTLLHYLVKTKEPFKHSYVPSTALLLTALASAWMYIAPSMKAGQREGGETDSYLQLTGNTVGAGLVVLNVGDHYVGILRAAQDALRFLKQEGLIDTDTVRSFENIIQKCLRGCHKTLSWLQQSQLHILFLAALTATPLGAAAWFYKDYLGESEGLLWLKTTLTFAVYTVTHTLPVSLILNVPWLNALLVKTPIFPFLTGRYIYRRCLLTEQDLLLIQKKQESVNEQLALHRQVIGALFGLIDQIQMHGFVRKNKWFVPSLPENFTQLLEGVAAGNEDSALELLPKIQQHYARFVPVTSSSTASKVWQYLYNSLKELCGVFGSVLVGGSIVGYLKLNYDLFYSLAGNNSALAVALIIAPAITSEVLVAYFGYLAFTGAYEYLMTWPACEPRVPYAFKLNPILSTFFLGVMFFLSFFGYGAALQLVHDTFDPDTYGEVLCSLLEICAKYGLIAYGCINFTQLLDKIVEPLAQRIGSLEQKQYIVLLNILRRLAVFLDRLEPELLNRILNTIDDPAILKILGLEKSGDVLRPIAATTTNVSVLDDTTPDVSVLTSEPAIASLAWGFSSCCQNIASFFYSKKPKASPEISEEFPFNLDNIATEPYL